MSRPSVCLNAVGVQLQLAACRSFEVMSVYRGCSVWTE